MQADDIIVDASLGWSGANVLALDAWQSVLVEKPVSVSGAGGLSVATDDGGKNGYFGFLGKGHVTFANLSDMLTISGSAYTLVGDIATLAADIAQNPAGDYALANDYDAKIDGIYATSPIPTEFGGNFEGLGNTISRLSIDDPENADYVGLFARPASGSTVENTRLLKLSISGNAGDVGGIAAVSFGFISNDFVSGTLISSVQNGGAYIGGLVGYNSGMITRSHATGTIGSDQFGTTGGGLVGYNFNGSITQSYADCVVSSGDDGGLGGLVGSNAGPITQSYSMGSVAGGDGTWVGGLTGANGMITQAYSTTALKDLGHKNHDAGGLIGVDKAGGNSSDYWDTSTSRIKKLNEGAGTPKNDPGITGLTTEQLQSGLPSGFDPKVWAEDPKINGGFPYLINNPPRE
ncbi:MAG TPA: GLUG motif-containing protein [Rhizomicrobium sp.]|nr:GLUG motif-containing protein [Rhizomicrobium sp.]